MYQTEMYRVPTYELPKIHKEDNPLKIIVSCINSPEYPLAYLKKIIDRSLKKEFGYIKNSFELINKINRMTIDSNYKLISFDIVSMYSNISTDLIINNIKKRWNLISKNTMISM